MRVELPESFEKRMQEMLGDEYESYIESYDNPRQYGLRINPMKITEEELAEGSGFSLDPIPWTKTGYFYKEEDQPARHPYYSAGLYYLQEPSAMTPAARFPVALRWRLSTLIMTLLRRWFRLLMAPRFPSAASRVHRS